MSCINIGIGKARINLQASSHDEVWRARGDETRGHAICAGATIADEAWHQIRLSAMFDCCKWDAQSQDRSVLANYPLFLGEGEWNAIARDAESLSAEVLAAEREIFLRSELHSRLGLPARIVRAIRDCGEADIPKSVARVMRFDFHLTGDGWPISEVNCDVPGGFVEASGFTKLVAEYFTGTRTCGDPTGEYARALARAADGGTLALVHATWHSDDRQVMEYLSRRLRELGSSCALVGPEEIAWISGEAKFRRDSAARSDLTVARFFPAEWLPGAGKRKIWEPWFRGSRSALSNPGTALLVQSKRFPLAWRALRTPTKNWRRLLPETRSVTDVDGPLSGWVFKPTLGRVGENIAIEGVTQPAIFQKIVREARRNEQEWVAQRRFAPISIDTPDGARFPCIGVFTLEGRTIGAYGRVAARQIVDQDAQDVAVLMRSGMENR
jgi:glutathionylspermidine synthase